MEKMSIYFGVLSESLDIVQKVIETLFPENKTLLIRENNALRSDGELFEASVEPYHYYENLTWFLLPGSLLGPAESFDRFLKNFIIECDKNGVLYDMEFEGNINSEFIEKKIVHPDFYRLVSTLKDGIN